MTSPRDERVVILGRAAHQAGIRRLGDVIKALATENGQLRAARKVVIVTAEEMDRIEIASKVSKQMKEIVPLLEKRLARGDILTAAQRSMLSEAGGLVRLDHAVQNIQREGGLLLVA